ncbi:hypothetical protein ACFL3G_11855, partial [Planctomycetota bacterium]
MILKRFIKSKYLPLIFSIVAVVMMLPTLKSGLMMDDLVQRVPQLKLSQIPPELNKTGMVPENTGALSTVLFETFGFPRDRERIAMGRNYGALPWWLPDDTKCSLWRPFTAFTHWLDYRLFPDSPVLMHAHNIAWFAAVVFLVTLIYRRIIGPTGIATLAALMFVLDKNTYFPVMFVANRGFIVSLCLGLACFGMHYKWRTTNSTPAAILSVIFLSLSLLANEAGVSTFAFILAYALVLDKEAWPKRFLSLMPAIVTVIVWRIIYQSLGYGVSGIGAAYIDPGHEPLKFLYHLPGYLNAIIAGQLSASPPDSFLGVSAQYFGIILIFYIVFTLVAIVLFLPVICRNKMARFWSAVMLFAAIPIVAAPGSKNFAFVSIGAFGLIAVFFDDLVKNRNPLPVSQFYKRPAWIFCIILLIIHVPMAAISKTTTCKIAPTMFGAMANPSNLNNVSLSNDCDVVIVNAPFQISVTTMPFNAAYYDQPIPNSIRTLGFAYTGLEVERTDERTLVIRSKEDNIFTSDQSSPVHFSHAFAIIDQLLCSSKMFEKNRRFVLEGMTVEVLEVDDKNLPREIAFT